jgi:hypothetical protein
MSAMTIYAALSALNVTISAVAPTVYGVSNAPYILRAAQCPARVLQLNGDSAQSEALTLGATPALATRWQITDTLYYRPAAHGLHITHDDTPLLAYADSYLAALRANRALADGVVWERLTLTPGVYSFAKVAYLGVQARVELVERG